MQNSKYFINRSPQRKAPKFWRISKEGAAIMVFVSILIWLVSTSSIVGQFEIKKSTLILNRDGCIHLLQVGITPQPQPGSDTCRIELSFRPDLIDAGGRISVVNRVIKIPESQLISFSPLAEQPWTSHHWFLLAWEICCVLLVLLAAWLAAKCQQWEEQHGH